MSIYGRKHAHVICSSYHFLGLDPILSDRAQEWLDYSVSLSKKFNCPFTEGSCSPGNTRWVLFKNCERTLKKNMSIVDVVELMHRSEREPFCKYEGLVFSCLDNTRNDACFGIHKELLHNTNLVDIGIKFYEIIKPKYAIFYNFPFVYYPGLYTSGSLSGELDRNPSSVYYNERHDYIAKQITKWGVNIQQYEDMVCNHGYLRDVYPINFISDVHLNKEVFPKTTLRNWIESEDHRGTLTKITDELYAWIVPDEDLELVTIALAPTGILLCVNKDDPHRYDYGVRPEDQISLPKAVF